MSSGPEIPPPENYVPVDYKDVLKDKTVTKWTDPCDHSNKASMQCLNRNNYDRERCLEYFKAYRECKAAWLEQRREDRRAGRAV